MDLPHVELSAPTHRRPPPFDVVLAVGLAAFCSGISSRLADAPEVSDLGSGPWMYAGVVLCALPLAFRRVRPLTALSGSILGLALYVVVGSPGGPTYAVPLIGIYSVGFYVVRPRLGTVIAVAASLVLVAKIVGPDTNNDWQVVAFWPLWALAATFVGLGGRNRCRQINDDARRVREWEEAQQADAQRQVAEERLRIARDIHDVVAHSLASIAVLAGAGSRVVDSDPAAAKRVLDDIRRTSSDALGEVRATIGDLRSGTEPSGATSADLEKLFAQMSASGLDVTREIDVDLAALDDERRTIAYRVVQESLTNVLRHAGSSRAWVTLASQDDGISIVVRDHGRGASPDSAEGHGLVGMRERVRGIGGIVTADDHPDGGFVVAAWIPASPVRNAVAVPTPDRSS